MAEQQIVSVTEDELVGALDALDVPFLTGGAQNASATALTADELLAGLARSSDARVRSALIPLLLRHPEFAPEAKIADKRLNTETIARSTLECFYTAAVLLQRKYAKRLAQSFGRLPELPDLFSDSLRLELTDDIEISLRKLGERNAELRGLDLNWVGTYEHAARTWLEYMEWRVKREAHEPVTTQAVGNCANNYTKCASAHWNPNLISNRLRLLGQLETAPTITPSVPPHTGIPTCGGKFRFVFLLARFLIDYSGSWKLRQQLHQVCLRTLESQLAEASFVFLLARFLIAC
ncbi:MAG: hypothetical protein HY741_20255 [Chloroflexi bacterium]|nr:hypothetical protein [Chloroflexota bacterium]